MSKKSATKSATKSTTSRAKALTKSPAARVARPVSLETRIEQQDAAKAAWEKAAKAALMYRGTDADRAAELDAARIAAWEAFKAARFARWGTMHAERAIARGDGTFPGALVEDSAGIRQAVIDTLSAHLAWERSRTNVDSDLVKSITLALKGARLHLVG